MGEIIQLAVKNFEKLGLTPLAILLLTVMVLLFTWLFKQVTLRQENLLEEDRVETIALLNQYCTLYKTLILFKEEIEPRETLLIDYTNSLPYLKRETNEKLDGFLFNDQPIDECIDHIKEQIQVFMNRLEEISPRFDRGTTSGRIGFTIRIVELIFQPIFITLIAFVSFLYFMFVGLQTVSGPNITFMNNLTKVLNGFLLLSFLAAIVDKRFKYSSKKLAFILGYFAIVIFLLVIHNVVASVIALILFFVFTTIYNPKTK